MKKFVSLMLTMLLVFALFSPVVTALAADDGEHPTIYLYGGNTEDIFLPDGTQVFPAQGSGIDITEILMPVLKELASGIVRNDYKDVSKIIYDALVPSVAAYATDKNGDASNGSAPKYSVYTQEIPQKSENYGPEDYRMNYDWRLSPLETAKELKDFIDRVLETTGEDKVNLMGRCYGANVIQAYLTLYKEHALQYVDDVAYIAPAVNGIDFLSALFTGDVYFDAEAVNNFADYYFNRMDLIPDEATNELVLSLLDLLKEVKTLDLTMGLVNCLVGKIKYDLLPPIMRDAYARMLSYWSMVPSEYVDKAIDFVFAGCKEENAQFINRILEYHNTVQLKAEDTLLELQKAGIDFYIVAKYDVADYPLYKGAQAMADGYILTRRQTFGGEYADIGAVFSKKYIEANKDNKYLSPDYKVNAQTCIFPDTTWFIKDLVHDVFPDNLNEFTVSLMNGEKKVSDGEISQFLTYEDDEIVPTQGTDEDYEKESIFDVFVRFFKALFNLLKNLMQK